MTDTKQIRQYKIKVDLSKVYQIVKDHKLREYKGSFPVINLTASDPDEACYLVYKNLSQLLRDHNVSENMITAIMSKVSIDSVRIND